MNFEKQSLKDENLVKIATRGDLEDLTLAQKESVGVAKVLQSEKNTVEILDAIDICTPEKCKNPDKNARNGRIGSSGKRDFRITQYGRNGHNRQNGQIVHTVL